jgi:hypothetical protein
MLDYRFFLLMEITPKNLPELENCFFLT